MSSNCFIPGKDKCEKKSVYPPIWGQMYKISLIILLRITVKADCYTVLLGKYLVIYTVLFGIIHEIYYLCNMKTFFNI